MNSLDIKTLELWAIGDIATFLNISKNRTHILMKNYKVPFVTTSAGKIFLKKDILSFQEARKDNMKHKKTEH